MRCLSECQAIVVDHAPERTWRHLDTMQFETILKARIPRVNCSKCGVKTISVPWETLTLHTMFEAFAIDVLQCARVKSAAALLGLSWDAAHEIMKRAVERGLAKRDLEGIRYVGIDEKSFGKGQDYVSVMTDPKASRSKCRRSKRGIRRYSLEFIDKYTESHISAVTIDMWQAYENSVASHAPQAEIVLDRFHISKHLNEGVDKVRREEHRELIDERLKGKRYHFLFNAEKLDEERQQELDALQKQQLRTGRAWSIKDYFRWFWDEPDAIAGREFFDHWYNWAIRSRLEPMKKVAKMLKNRLDNILSWFRHRITNSNAEGFNSRIQAIKSNARGFKSFQNYRTRILFFCGKLALKPDLNCH